MGSDEQEFPPQQLDRPGEESEMAPEPQDEMRSYEGTGKLSGREVKRAPVFRFPSSEIKIDV